MGEKKFVIFSVISMSAYRSSYSIIIKIIIHCMHVPKREIDINCKRAQRNMPQKLGSREDLMSKN